MARFKRRVVEVREYIVSADGEDDAYCAEVDDDGEWIEQREVISVEFYDAGINDEPDDMPDCMDRAKEKMIDDADERDKR